MRLLTINMGSSSLKAAIYHESARASDLSAQVERIGLSGSRMVVKDSSGALLLDRHRDVQDHSAALRGLIEWLQHRGQDKTLGAVGHRVVHGGVHFRDSQVVTPELIATLRELVPLAPDHLPQTLGAIEIISGAYPEIPQVACFDTAFHRSMPPVAQKSPLPRQLADEGVLRYGFHGLSCESIMQELAAIDRPAASGRIIIAHLGNGASMTAVRGGISIDNTMGFTPAGGLMMGTRSGDLDPGLVLYLLESKGMSPQAVNKLVNQEAGLLGVSGISEDVRDLLAREAVDSRAAEALELFCYQARKFLGALVTVLGGLDTLIFTGGIGEHATPIRHRLCQGLEFLGVHIEPSRNARHEAIISGDDSKVVVRVMRTDEDLMIARHTWSLVSHTGVSRARV